MNFKIFEKYQFLFISLVLNFHVCLEIREEQHKSSEMNNKLLICNFGIYLEQLNTVVGNLNTAVTLAVCTISLKLVSTEPSSYAALS
jgi:hypothetical protein